MFWSNSKLIRQCIQTELLPSATRDLDSGMLPNLVGNKIGFNKCAFSWNSFGSQPNGRRHRFKLTIGDEVVFQRGVINLILGPTASGKVILVTHLCCQEVAKLRSM